MSSGPELTIVSVFHDNYTKRLIELNESLVRKLNPTANWVWLVGDNSLPARTDEFSDEKLNVNDKERLLRPAHVGQLDPVKFKTVRSYGYTFNSVSHGKFWIAYSLAEGLRRCLARVKTRFLVNLDNDFYVVRPNWISDTISHMKENDLAFLGAPYYPADYAKYRYFPAASFFLFIDLEKIPPASLDFDARFHLVKLESEIGRHKNGFLPLFSIPLRKKLINSSPDIGYNIFARYYDHPVLRTECVLPVYNPLTDLGMASYAATFLNCIFEFFLPDRLSYVPKRADYYTKKGFRTRGYPEVRNRGWQEHMWQGEPFGFHIHGMRQRKDHGIGEEEIIKSVEDALKMYAK